MKRIINGLTYNTETAARIARFDYDNRPDEDDCGYQVLYQTRGGAFFLHAYRRVQMHDEIEADGGSVRETHSVEPLTRAAAHDWIMTGNVEVFADVFGEPPEASEEDSPEFTLYIRLPVALRDRLEAEARRADQTVNDWASQNLIDRLAESTKRRPR